MNVNDSTNIRAGRQAPNLYVHNARSLAKFGAIDCLKIDLNAYLTDIAFICETFLNRSHDMVGIDHYIMFTKNRVKRRGGGVAILVKDCYEASVINQCDSNFELLWVYVKFFKTNIVCGVLYHPPKALYRQQELFDAITKHLDFFAGNYKYNYIILGGDFNLLDTSQLVDISGLSMMNKAPTRVNNLLDYVFCSNDFWETKLTVTSSVRSDHKAIILMEKGVNDFRVASKQRNVKCYRPHGCKLIDKFLKNTNGDNYIYQSGAINTVSFDTYCNDFLSSLRNSLDKHFPLRAITICSSDPGFITAGIKVRLRKRNKLMRKGRVIEAAAITEEIRRMIIKSKSLSCNNISTRKAAKYAWTRINAFINPQSKPSHTENVNIDADTLNNHYCNMSSDRNYSFPLRKSSVINCKTSFDLVFSPYEVLQKLLRIKVTSMGPDLLPYWYLVCLAPMIAHQICAIFNDSIRLSHYPSIFHDSRIAPIPKIKSPVSCQDYRPIAITSIIARLFDNFMLRKYFYPAMITNSSYYKCLNQFAFRPTGSCESALIFMLDKITHLLSTNKQVYLIAVDMSKAFDTVKHSSVIESIAGLQIPDEIYNWTTSYLNERRQCTYFNNICSKFLGTNAGVIQGSGLGPVLFSLTIADLKVKFDENYMVKYADDCFVIIPETSGHTISEEIDNIVLWAADKGLNVNREKSKIMAIHTKRGKRDTNCSAYENCCFRKTDDMVILGVRLGRNLSFTSHIEDVISKCNRIFYCLRILKNQGLEKQSCRDIFVSVIIAYLTYSIQAWIGFCGADDKKRLQKIVQRGIKMNIVDKDEFNFDDIVVARAASLFAKITRNEHHVLHQLLPSKRESKYVLRPRGHSYSLPEINGPHDTRNYIMRMLYL